VNTALALLAAASLARTVWLPFALAGAVNVAVKSPAVLVDGEAGLVVCVAPSYLTVTGVEEAAKPVPVTVTVSPT
jgi:hypothetical protein